MISPTRKLAYVVYYGPTLASFACAGLHPNDITVGLATNLLAGLIIVSSIDTPFRIGNRDGYRFHGASFLRRRLDRNRLLSRFSKSVTVPVFLSTDFRTARPSSAIA